MPKESLLEKDTSNGHHGEPETEEQLAAVYKRLEEFVPPDGSLVTLSKPDKSLMQLMLRGLTEEFREQALWRACDFMDDEEAYNHVTAYFEAKDLGMDTAFNVAYAFSLVSVNRKGPKTNLMAILTDTLQFGKWPLNQHSRGQNRNNGSNSRSPIG